MMHKLRFFGVILAVSLSYQAKASTFTLDVAGSGVSGTVTLTYGTVTDSKVTEGFVVTGISGIFSDSNNGLDLVNAAITGLVPINNAKPDPTNLLAPTDFSRFAVATGLPPVGGHPSTSVSYDNLLYPNGSSPGVATDYDFGGGYLDIYGVLFTVSNGDVVNLWSNGVTPFAPFSYGAAVVNSDEALDYESGGVQVVPEPGSMAAVAGGLVGLLAWRRARVRRRIYRLV